MTDFSKSLLLLDSQRLKG